MILSTVYQIICLVSTDRGKERRKTKWWSTTQCTLQCSVNCTGPHGIQTVLLVLYPQIQWGGIMPGQGCYDWMYFPWWLESNLKCETDQWLNEPVWNKALFHDFRSICSIANWLILRSFTASSFKLTPLSNISRSWFWNSVSGLLALCSSGVSKYFFYASLSCQEQEL